MRACRATRYRQPRRLVEPLHLLEEVVSTMRLQAAVTKAEGAQEEEEEAVCRQIEAVEGRRPCLYSEVASRDLPSPSLSNKQTPH